MWSQNISLQPLETPGGTGQEWGWLILDCVLAPVNAAIPSSRHCTHTHVYSEWGWTCIYTLTYTWVSKRLTFAWFLLYWGWKPQLACISAFIELVYVHVETSSSSESVGDESPETTYIRTYSWGKWELSHFQMQPVSLTEWGKRAEFKESSTHEERMT